MTKKRVLALLLAAALLIASFAACGNNAPTSSAPESSQAEAQPSSAAESSEAGEAAGNVNLEGYPIVNEPLTVSMMGVRVGIHGDWDKMEFFQIMEEKTGINFTFDTPAGEVFEEKKNLALNGGTYPEVFFAAGLSKEQQVKFGSQGILLPLEDLIDKYCPNIQKMFEEVPGTEGSITAPDGHIYALPQLMVLPIALAGSMWVNIDWLDALEIAPEDLPTTVDGFYDLLVRFRDEDPNGNGEQDEVPFTLFEDTDKGDSLYKNFLPYFGVLSPEFYVDDSGVIHYGMLDENTKVAFQWFQQLFQEKLLDNNCYVQGSADAMAQGSEGKNGAGFHALPRFVFGNMEIEKEAQYPCMPALSSSVNPQQTTTKGNGLTQGCFALTDKCSEETAIAMMRWVDYLYSEEGTTLCHFGPEGHIWEVSDKDPAMKKWIQPEDGRNTEEVRGGEITPACGAGCPYYFKNEYYLMDDLQEEARKNWVETNMWPYAKTILPEMYLTEEEQATIDMYYTDLKKYRQENSAAFVANGRSLDEWDSFVEGLKSLNIDELIAVYQQAYDRWAAANS